MNLNRRRMRLKARQNERGQIHTITHEELAERARKLGCPAFCNGWHRETLIHKIQEKENGNS